MAESENVLKAGREVGSETGYGSVQDSAKACERQAGPTGVPSG